jgi:hypothetical protein
MDRNSEVCFQMKRPVLLVACALLARGTSASATLTDYPQDGLIGVYGDPAGTNCCIDIPPGNAATLYVYATTSGSSSGGISGAEFRIEVSPPALGAFFIWTSNPTANITLGNPIDNTDAAGDLTGVNIAFPTCQKQAGQAGDRIVLGTITAIAVTGEHTLYVKKHNRPSNPNLSAALLILCNAPDFTAVPLTLEDGDPALNGQEPYVFSSPINRAGCAGATCGFVAVKSQTWSGLKDLYR